MKLIPYRSELKQYRIWHSPAAHGRHMRQVELVEAYNGKEAQKIVMDKFPGHTVGNAILVRK